MSARLFLHRGPSPPENVGAEEAFVEPEAGAPGPQAPVGQGEGCLRGHGHEQGQRHHLVHQGRLEGSLGFEAPAREDEIQAAGKADQARQPLRPPRPRQKSKRHLGKADHGLGIVGGHAVAAGERGLQSSAQAGTVDGHHHRHGNAFQPIQDRLTRAGERFSLERAADLEEVLDVRARDEVVRFAAPDHDRLYGPVPLQLAQQGLELLQHALGEGIDLLPGHVDRDQEDAARVQLAGEGLGPAHAITPPARQCAISSRP